MSLRALQYLRAMSQSRIAANIGWLSAVQFANLLFPIVTLPWILRALEPTMFGRYAFHMAIAQYASMLIDYGFYLATTRRIAASASTPEETNEIYWEVQSAKLFLFLGVAAVSTFGLFLFESIVDPALLLASLAGCIGTLLTPMWLFAGHERLKPVAIVMLVVRLGTIAPLVTLVRAPDDAWRAAAIMSGGTIAGGALVTALALRARLVRAPRLPRLHHITRCYREGWHFFVANAAVSFYSALNPIVLSAVSTPAQVGLFSAADRLKQISLGLLPPFTQALYPRMSRLVHEDMASARRLAFRTWVLWMMLMGFSSALLFFAAEPLVRLFMGNDFAAAVPLVRILAIVPVVVACGSVLGQLLLLPMGRQRLYSHALLVVGLLNMMLIYAFGAEYGATAAAIALVVSEIAATVLLALAFRATVRSKDWNNRLEANSKK